MDLRTRNLFLTGKKRTSNLSVTNIGRFQNVLRGYYKVCLYVILNLESHIGWRAFLLYTYIKFIQKSNRLLSSKLVHITAIIKLN